MSNGEINRELTLLKRAFNLAIQAGKLISKPYIPLLKERNVRTGFFERHQFDSIGRHLSEVLRRMLTVAYITGWRIPSEIQTLEWRQVDFAAGELRLDPGTTKNDDGRVFPLTAELRAVLEQQWQVTQALAQANGRIYPWVFHSDGEPVRSFIKTWRTATRKAGCPGRIPHDFRRTAVRNLVRAGVPERVAMQLTGHKTRSVFERYNIVSPGDLRDAAKRLDVATGIVLGIAAPQSGLEAASERAKLLKRMEAPPGFEPGMEVLQTSALPLGDGAVRRDEATARAERGWSGKRDSNPRLRPWQGRTLPLSYSRPSRHAKTYGTTGFETASRHAQALCLDGEPPIERDERDCELAGQPEITGVVRRVNTPHHVANAPRMTSTVGRLPCSRRTPTTSNRHGRSPHPARIR